MLKVYVMLLPEEWEIETLKERLENREQFPQIKA
jgi:hypothetical protein